MRWIIVDEQSMSDPCSSVMATPDDRAVFAEDGLKRFED